MRWLWVGQQIMASAAMNFTAVPKAASLRASSFRSGKAVSMAKPAKAAVVSLLGLDRKSVVSVSAY